MKQKIALCLSFALCCTLFAGCGKKTVASSAISPAPASSSIAQSSKPVSASSRAQSSTSVAASSSSTMLKDGVAQSLTFWYGDGGTKHAVIAMTLPAEWEISGSTIVDPNGIKRIEFVALHENADPADLFPTSLTYDYATGGGMQYPEGYGFQRMITNKINDNPFQMYTYKTWPDDSDKAWFPHYTFYAINGCVLQVNFYSFTETDEDALFHEILASLQLEL